MKLLAAITLVACFTILPSCVTAQETWKKGDKVAAFFICKEEKDIMDIVLADSKGIQNFKGLIVEKRITRDKHPDKIFFTYANTVATIASCKRQYRK